jgi:aminoglycoside phosphotransferase (APT) family kinase protein
MPFLTFGEFVGRELAIEPFDQGDLRQWFNRHAEDIGFSRSQVDSLYDVLDAAEDLAADGAGRVCLVHSDFNPKNLLVDPETAELTGLIDWEFAHAGSPYSDLGNLLRFCTDPVLGGAVLDVVRRAPGLGDRLEERGRAADLWAVIDLAARAAANPVATAAHTLLTRIADMGELAGGRLSLRYTYSVKCAMGPRDLGRSRLVLVPVGDDSSRQSLGGCDQRARARPYDTISPRSNPPHDGQHRGTSRPRSTHHPAGSGQ